MFYAILDQNKILHSEAIKKEPKIKAIFESLAVNQIGKDELVRRPRKRSSNFSDISDEVKSMISEESFSISQLSKSPQRHNRFNAKLSYDKIKQKKLKITK